MMISLNKASKITGINTGTLKAHIKDGTLYAEQDTYRHKWSIDPEDLVVYWHYVYMLNKYVMYSPERMQRRINYYVYGIWD